MKKNDPETMERLRENVIRLHRRALILAEVYGRWTGNGVLEMRKVAIEAHHEHKKAEDDYVCRCVDLKKEEEL